MRRVRIEAMFKRVLWATDGSEAADRALEQAAALAFASDGPYPQLVAVHCEELAVPGKTRGASAIAGDGDDVKMKIADQVGALDRQGVRAAFEMTRSRLGGAAHAIAEIAEREHADVIVVGTRGRTPLGGLLLGSVTQRLLHIAPCPVLAVPPPRNGTGS
jgi:nucleotide-binding universal stress UspA family protein